MEASRGVRIRLVVAYDGAGFHGFARQRGLRTVQGVLEDTLSRLLGSPIEVHGSGRTDAGVHARAQVVHFDQSYGPPAEKYVRVLEHRLPPDVIPVYADAPGGDFHARFDVVRKSYRYTIYTGKQKDLFKYRFTWHVPEALDLDAMREAAVHLVGTYDFTSFCASAAQQVNKVREVFSVRVEEDCDAIHIHCEGSGFLQYMVRIITGTLVDVGRHEIDSANMPNILAGQDRRLAGQTAPPQGLCLWNVEYPVVYGGKVLDL